MSETAQRVDDEENYVDQQRKQEILESRANVRQWRQELFFGARTGEVDDQNAVVLFSDPVREYLMNIEPLLKLDLPNAQEVYQNSVLGTIVLTPPEEYVEDATKRRTPGDRSGKTVTGDLDPKEHTVVGLREVIERESVTATWEVHIRWHDPKNAPDGTLRKTVTPTVEEPLSREVLRNAIRAADAWLQQAGVGVDIDAVPYRSEEPGL